MPSKKITRVLTRCLTLALFLSTLSLISSQSASANIPASARLIGNGGTTSTILNTNGLSATEFAKCASSTGIRGITSDGTHVYFRPSNNATIICKTTLSGVFVSANTVINSGQPRTFEMYTSDSRALTYANGCILFRGGGDANTDKGFAAGSDFMCVDTTNWTMYGPFTPSVNYPVPLGGFWLTSNIMNFPDGRVGVVSAPNAGRGTGPSCTANFCKYLRLYNVTRTGNTLTFAFDRDITLGDSVNSGWPDDDHGMATDGTYLYQIRYNAGYKVWELSNTATSQVIFNGDGSGNCGAATGISGGLCNINTSVGWSSSNATFFGRSHATNQYIMGDYNSNNRFWISTSSAPPVGIGSDVTAPVLSAQSASSITQTTATLNFTAGEAGTYFYLVYPSASSAPDSATVVSQGASAPTVVKGTSSATASANAVSVTGLSAGTAYKAYVVVRDSSGNVSLVSTISLTTVVASPAFTLSSSSETRTYSTSGTAFTINSTGGLIASFSISATPPGMSFDTSTGTLTGAPTTIAAATSYTVTATNVSGTATRSFVLTVTARPLTIKAADKTTTYSGAAASVVNSYSITSGTLAGSDTFTALTYTYSSVALSYNSQTAPTNAASYTITPSAASFSVGSASNYAITYSTGILTINKADSITVTATPSTTTYNASPITPAYLVSGLKGAETATVTSNFLGINGTTYPTTNTPPTNVGSYRYLVSDIVISAGASLNNYQGVIYESATVTINKAFQAKLSVGQYDAYPGISSYPLNVYGGTGLGSVTRTLVDTGTAGCALSGILILTATNAGTCTVRAVKDGGSNYFTETTTATIYWIPFINRYIASGPSTPTDLGLSGSTAFTKLTYESFTVLSFANGSGIAVSSASVGSILRIIGTGFNASDSTTEVFFGMISVSAPLLAFNVVNPLANYIQLTVPTDAETDRVVIRSSKGWATSPGTLTITP